MKYYLGYYQNDHYVPIKDSEVGDSILSIVNFTTSFSSISNLKKYLFEKKLIPHQDTYLNYLIEKGQKNNKYYIEQPYNGIYKISQDLYNLIEELLM